MIDSIRFPPTRLWLPPICLAMVSLSVVDAQPNPFSRFASYRSIEADSRKTYELSESNGPWMIMAASFAGETAEPEAKALIHEMRKRYKWSAYLHQHHYDFTQSVPGRGVDEFGKPKVMKYRQADEFTEFAVLVGDFTGVDDPALQATLKAIKYCQPSCLTFSQESPTSLRFAGLRAFHKRMVGDEARKKKGPLGQAFVTRNPLLPQEYFTPGGIDAFVEQMNAEVPHSLLDCRAKYTVRVATFKGSSVIDPKEVHRIESGGSMKKSKLTQAAEMAHELTLALRKRGVEAYQFHDRTESVVTVGSFESVGTKREDGKIEIDSRVLQVIESYGARPTRQTIEGAPALKPRSLGGIPLDVQPLPVQVPRRSIATDYARQR